MNPCPCGYYGHKLVDCRCTPDVRLRYQSRISGPLLDRIDIQMEVGAVDPATLAKDADGETTAVIAARVQAATNLQLKRQGKRNQYLTTREIDQYCKLDKEAKALLKWAMESFHWSSRAYHRILRVARTIADLSQSDDIHDPHVMEAVQYRRALRE
jgi:magnesium chelatase family protein